MRRTVDISGITDTDVWPSIATAGTTTGAAGTTTRAAEATGVTGGSTTRVADEFMTRVAGGSTTGVADEFTTRVAGGSTTGVADEFTTRVVGGSTTGVAAEFTTGVAGGSTTRVAAKFTTGVATFTTESTTGFNGIVDGPGVASLRIPVPKPDVMLAKAKVDVRNLISFRNLYTHIEVLSVCHSPASASFSQKKQHCQVRASDLELHRWNLHAFAS